MAALMNPSQWHRRAKRQKCRFVPRAKNRTPSGGKALDLGAEIGCGIDDEKRNRCGQALRSFLAATRHC